MVMADNAAIIFFQKNGFVESDGSVDIFGHEIIGATYHECYL